MAPSIDEFEDLTQFADESFDTDEVDLFEFSDDEDSPLLRLKSIVLSLDWEITEETLAELSAELTNLRDLWKDDKVAQIYLQGMENVGRYLRTEGAYAHPNAIKLLLTLYSNYEKIISSAEISDAAVTTMLKADIRKFKVLQYQISMGKDGSAGPAADGGGEADLPEQKKGDSPLHSMEATILGLEWEVTDEGLEKFHAEATRLRKQLNDNTDAQVLVQGLQALGAYIRQQKSEAHPDAFTILHSFYDALKSLLEHSDLTAEQRRRILVEQISSLNSLKDIIARSAASGRPAAEADDDDEAPPLEDKKTAVSAEDEASGADLPEPELEEVSAVEEDDLNLDRLFAGETEEDSGSPLPEPPAALTEDDDEEELDDLFADDGPAGSGKTAVTPALADEDEVGGFSGSAAAVSVSKDRAAELDEKLNSFFDFSDDEAGAARAREAEAAGGSAPSLARPAVQEPPDEKDEEDLAGRIDDKPEHEIDSFFNFDEDEAWDSQTAAVAAEVKGLSLEPQEDGNVAAEESGEEESTEEGEILGKSDDEFDSFFNFAEDEDWDTQPVAPAAPLSLDTQPVPPAAEPDDELDSGEGPAALADSDEEGGFDERAAAAGIDSERAAEINEKLDSFFHFDDEPGSGRKETAPAEEEDALPGGAAPDTEEDPFIDSFAAASPAQDAAADDELDSFFALAGKDADAAPDQEVQELDDQFITALDEEDDQEHRAAEEDSLLDDAAPAGRDAAREDEDGLAPFFALDSEGSEGLAADRLTALEDEEDGLSGGTGEDDAASVRRDEPEDEFVMFFGEDELNGGQDESAPAAALAFEEPTGSPADTLEDEDAEAGQTTGTFTSFLDEEGDDFPGSLPEAGEEDDDLFHFDGGLAGAEDEEESPAAVLATAEDEEDEPFGLDEEFVLTADDEELPPAVPEDDDGAEAFGFAAEEGGEECLAAADESVGRDEEETAETADGRDDDGSHGLALAAENIGRSAALSSLIAAAAVLSSAPSAKVLHQVAELAAAVRAADSNPPHQAIVLNLLDSSASLIARAPAADGSAIVGELAAGLEKAEDLAVLAEMISRYTAWQEDFFAKIMASRETSMPEEVIETEKTGLHQLQEGVSSLRETVMAEFSQLRKELKVAMGSPV